MEEDDRMQCRLWWPGHLCSQPSHNMLLFGWVITGFSKSLDIVVAASLAMDESALPSSSQHLQAIIESAHSRMPFHLQEFARLFIVGHCIPEHGCNNIQSKIHGRTNILVPNNTSSEGLMGNDVLSTFHSGCDAEDLQHNGSMSKRQKSLCMDSSMAYNCHRLVQYRQCGITTCVWIELFSPVSLPSKEFSRIPQLHHLHWDGAPCVPDIHILLYEQPRYGSHHFSLKSWSFLSESSEVPPNHDGSSPMRPQWVADLEQQQESTNLDVVVLGMNSAAAVQNTVQECIKPLGTSCKRLSLLSIVMGLLKSMTAASLALVATVFYISLQLISRFLNKAAFMILKMFLLKLFTHTWTNLCIRSHQLIYWPVILKENGCRSQPSVAIAHRTALLKHSIWSAIAVDIFLGNLGGLTLLTHCEATRDWVVRLAHGITDDVLRSGCVWLMGAPAGFKLNTELAGTLGIISLNVIQVWSTLWFFINPFFKYFICVLAISGIFLGLTIPAALLVDVLLLATLHVSTLHWLVALLYSHQIQALAALWRLFRGRKRNPLRGRIDSYDYSVEQHVVGSLVFTPLLLLLPTTSVFYVFFTILNTAVSGICIGLQFFIAILHAFPYAEVGLRLMHPRRFPSGIWFKRIQAGSSKSSGGISDLDQEGKVDGIDSVRIASIDGTLKGYVAQEISAESQTGHRSLCSQDSETVICVLGINIASLGEIISPHFRKVVKGLSLSSGVSCAYKVFSGGRCPSSLDIGMPAVVPWMSISLKEFWWLAYEAVLACL